MKMYQIVEQGRGLNESYMLGFDSDAELGRYLHGKETMSEIKNYSIVAWSVRDDGAGYVDVERYWRWNAIHKAMGIA